MFASNKIPLDTQRLDQLRELIGWVENGTCKRLTFEKDQDTRDFLLIIGDPSHPDSNVYSDSNVYRGSTLGGVIDRAAKAELASNADK